MHIFQMHFASTFLPSTSWKVLGRGDPRVTGSGRAINPPATDVDPKMIQSPNENRQPAKKSRHHQSWP